MHALGWCCALLCAAANIPDGSVIVLENSNPIVEAYTRSEVTHVGLVLQKDGREWVYEATPSVVRRIPLASYYEELGEHNRRRRESSRLRVRLYPPRTDYTDKELTDLKAFLDSQLGRRYSVKGYVRSRPGDGIHCAELVASALATTGRHELTRPYAINPAQLVSRLAPTHRSPIVVALPEVEPQGSLCQRSWGWWSGLWSWCAWASWETFTFCR
ncbi:MAG: hypothetical protein AB7F89_07655 [Pirellulaceae bacterium]